SDASLESKTDHARSAADIAFGNLSRCRAIHGLEHVLRLHVKSVDVVEMAVPCFGNYREGPKAVLADVVYGQLALVLHLPGNRRIAHHANTMSVSDESGAFQKSG